VGRNYEPVWKSIDPSQVNFIAGELDKKYSAPDIAHLLNFSSAGT